MAAYQVVTAADKRQLSDFLIREGQFLIPMVRLIEQSELAIEQVIDVTGRACVEAVLEMSAREVAGSKSPGKESGDVRWHGSQEGLAHLGDRKLRVRRPRLRHKTDGEAIVPAYEAIKTGGKLAARMMSILLNGVSTRKYKRVIPEMAETVGVSKSAVSRANIEAGQKLLEELADRRLDDLDLLIIYLDGIRLGKHHILGAVGVDPTGQKHVLGLREGSSENTTVVTELLNDLVRRGLAPDRRLQSVAGGDRRGVRREQSRTTLPDAQTAERAGSSAQGSARQRQIDAARGVETSRRAGQASDRTTGQMVREETSLGVSQLVGRPGRIVHDQRDGPAAEAPALPGDDERDREYERRRAAADQSREELAGRLNGSAMGVGRIRGDGSQLQQDHGPSAALDARRSFEAAANGRKSWRCEEGRVNHESQAATDPSTTNGATPTSSTNRRMY